MDILRKNYVKNHVFFWCFLVAFNFCQIQQYSNQNLLDPPLSWSFFSDWCVAQHLKIGNSSSCSDAVAWPMVAGEIHKGKRSCDAKPWKHWYILIYMEHALHCITCSHAGGHAYLSGFASMHLVFFSDTYSHWEVNQLIKLDGMSRDSMVSSLPSAGWSCATLEEGIQMAATKAGLSLCTQDYAKARGFHLTIYIL